MYLAKKNIESTVTNNLGLAVYNLPQLNPVTGLGTPVPSDTVPPAVLSYDDDAAFIEAIDSAEILTQWPNSYSSQFAQKATNSPPVTGSPPVFSRNPTTLQNTSSQTLLPHPKLNAINNFNEYKENTPPDQKKKVSIDVNA